MRQHPLSHVIANEVRRLKQLPPHVARAALTDRIGRAFALGLGSEYEQDFRAELDFNAHLVTHCRRAGVIWHRSA